MMQYRLLRTIGGKGTSPHQFSRSLRGVTIGPDGALYAVGDSGVKVFHVTGRLQRQWATGKPGYCISIDPQNIVYVGQQGQVERFTINGRPHDVWKDTDHLRLVTAIDFFERKVIIADAEDRCLRQLDPQGRWLNDIGKDNNTKGFLIPNGHLDFAIDNKGVIHASNSAKHRIEQYAFDGKRIGHWGRFGTHRPEHFPGCCNPTNLTLDRQGRTITAEKAGPRVKVYDAKYQLLGLIDGSHFDPNCKNMDVAIDKHGRIYVVDTVRLHICVFEPIKTESQPAESGGDQP
jgi:sugar lactone lactonase YvrE